MMSAPARYRRRNGLTGSSTKRRTLTQLRLQYVQVLERVVPRRRTERHEGCRNPTRHETCEFHGIALGSAEHSTAAAELRRNDMHDVKKTSRPAPAARDRMHRGHRSHGVRGAAHQGRGDVRGIEVTLVHQPRSARQPCTGRGIGEQLYRLVSDDCAVRAARQRDSSFAFPKGSHNWPRLVTTGIPARSSASVEVLRALMPSGYGWTITSQTASAESRRSTGTMPRRRSGMRTAPGGSGRLSESVRCRVPSVAPCVAAFEHGQQSCFEERRDRR